MDERVTIKHNIWGILAYLILAIFPLIILYRRDWSDVGYLHVLNTLLVIYFLILFFKALIFVYIRVENGEISIYTNALRKRSIAVSDIAEVKIVNNPFSRSHFLLRSGYRINFDSFGVAHADLERLQKVVGMNVS